MRDNNSNLRRRTRDSSWQWLLMGAILGLGVAMVLCVGSYALGAINFPALEGDSTPIVRVAPNETEVALQAFAGQQTLDAAQALATVATPLASDEPLDETSTDTGEPITANATPSPLPGNGAQPIPTMTVYAAAHESQPPVGVTVAPQDAALESPDVIAQVAAIEEASVAAALETPVVGTPPGGHEVQVLGLPQPAAIPPELDAVKSEMVLVTGGTFLMGTTPEEAKKAADECALYGKSCDGYLDWVKDSFPTHPVTVDSFQMEASEVSASQFVTFLNWLGPDSHKDQCQNLPCALTTLEEPNSYIVYQEDGTYAVRNPGFYSNHPATFVTWWGAGEFCAVLNRRLPTEAEWERAARGAQNFVYPWGFDFDPQLGMSSLPEDRGTVPVSSLQAGASPYGVLNLAGNVAEWVYDWYGADYYTQLANSPTPPSNPNGPIAGTERVLRGGSWDTIPFFLRSVHRMSAPPDQPRASIGFRCAANAVGLEAPTAPLAESAAQSGGESAPAGAAPTLAPVPTRVTPTNTPAGPTPTLAPG